MFRYRYSSIKSIGNPGIDRAVAQFIFEAKSSASKPSHPAKFRRLTREEAASRGVSYSAKRQVDVSVKRITQSTPIFTERQAVQARLGTTKERYQADILAKR